jgi:hypothetical protein
LSGTQRTQDPIWRFRLQVRSGELMLESLITEGNKQKGEGHFKPCPFYGHTIDNLLPSGFPFALQC